jgi:hypothetical protein
MRFTHPFERLPGIRHNIAVDDAQFSETRDLPPLKLAANELDSILSKAHSFLNAVNGPTEEGSTRESVKLGVRGYEIEIPHFSLASSVAFPLSYFLSRSKR